MKGIRLARHSDTALRKCGGCGNRDTGMLVLIPVNSSTTLTVCDACITGLHELLEKARPEGTKMVTWP